jgi:hypothetical protein
MILKLDKKVIVGLVIGFVFLIIITLIVIRFRSRSKYQYPVASSDALGTTMNTTLKGCQDTFNVSMITNNAMAAGTTKDTAIATAETAYANCVKGAVGTYSSSTCPEITTANIGTKPSDATKAGYYDTYTTSELPAIQVPYYSPLGTAISSFTRGGTVPSTDMVVAARKADLAGATRKYIAKVCPSFYTAADGTTAKTTAYTAWQTYTATPGNTSAEGFYGTNVTNASIITWADYAALTKQIPVATASQAISAGTASFSVTLNDATGFVQNDFVQFTYQTYNSSTGAVTTVAPVLGKLTAVNGAAITVAFYKNGSTAVPQAAFSAANPPVAMNAPSALLIPGGTVFARGLITSDLITAAEKWYKLDSSNVPNWKKARDYGPGSYPVQTWA